MARRSRVAVVVALAALAAYATTATCFVASCLGRNSWAVGGSHMANQLEHLLTCMDIFRTRERERE